MICFFLQAEDGIRDLVRSRGLGDVYKRQRQGILYKPENFDPSKKYPMITYFYEDLSDGLYSYIAPNGGTSVNITHYVSCLLYTSDAADERSSVDLGGRRIIKKKKTDNI